MRVVTAWWDLMLTLTTFVTTFFVSHAYTFWREAFILSRKVQGRISDLALIMATAGQRQGQRYTPEARGALAQISRRLGMTHVLFWAGLVRRAPGAPALHAMHAMHAMLQCCNAWPYVARGAHASRA